VASSIAEAEARYGASSSEIKRWHKEYYDGVECLVPALCCRSKTA
jgi:hypothetical protein